ncbi:hypothetical protein GCM10009648_43350 [Tsukamurella spumae]
MGSRTRFTRVHPACRVRLRAMGADGFPHPFCPHPFCPHRSYLRPGWVERRSQPA